MRKNPNQKERKIEMNEEIRNLIGVCADCLHLMCHSISIDDDDVYFFKCLLCGESINNHISTCSHFGKRINTTLFISNFDYY